MPSFDMGYTVTGEDIGEINIDDGDCLITGALLSQGYTFTPNKSAADTYIWQLGDLISGNEITFFSDVEMSEVLNLQFGTWEFEFSLTIETDGCFSTITDTLCIDVAGSIGELAEIELDIFPNPASSEVSVNSNEQIEAIHVLNAQGQLIAVDQPRRKNKLLSVEDLAPGLYFVTVQTASGRITRELMLE